MHGTAGKNVDAPETWLQLFSWDPALKLAPAVASTLLLILVMGRSKSPWALPLVLVFIPGVFFIILLGMHKSLGDAQDSGWVAKPQVSSVCCAHHHLSLPAFYLQVLPDLTAGAVCCADVPSTLVDVLLPNQSTKQHLHAQILAKA